ncbi:MAG: histidine--tRNA ligase [Lachnospiraceae bacterium]|nr:histidine--tRNA ligase [Lachnospiraceae bacterium]
MAMKKKPVTGMKDILPREMEIRNYVLEKVRKVYSLFGFTQIEAPVVEHIENLSSDQGGENEKLIFRILKRGEKLKLDEAKSEADLADSGLRYDLTVPLSRFYANNAGELPQPFMALHTGNVFRADRPQRGRFRQFVQCDIDILGEESALAEIELILATTTLLKELDFKDFTVRISDRRLLTAMAAYSGFDRDKYDEAFIILDKLDKIGDDGVREELEKAGFTAEAVQKCMGLFKEGDGSLKDLERIAATLGEYLDPGVLTSLSTIINSVESAGSGGFSISFDPVLVRGMSYYTGTIFEITIAEFGSSIAGGGRYDEMIGKFSGNPTPACGFSIGFERIITMLMERDFKVPSKGEKLAFLLDKGLSPQQMAGAVKEAMELRREGNQVLLAKMKKNKKFQKDSLAEQGYTEIRDFYADSYMK